MENNDYDEKFYIDYINYFDQIKQLVPWLGDAFNQQFHEKLPPHIKKRFQQTLNDFFYKPKKEKKWMCGHDKCIKEAIMSHEISEKKFLKHLSTEDSEAFILVCDIKNNPAFLKIDKKHTRNISTFYGYCQEHDQKLFSDIDAKSHELNPHFVNKQCAKTLLRKQRELESAQISINLFINRIKKENPEFLKALDVKGIIKYLSERRDEQKKACRGLKKLYKNIWIGINSKKYLIKYEEINVNKIGYYFSNIDYIPAETDKDDIVQWFFKLDFCNEPKAFICWLDNPASTEKHNSIMDCLLLYIGQVLVDSRKNIIFSSEFINNMPNDIKELFLENYDKKLKLPIILCAVIFNYFGFSIKNKKQTKSSS